MEELIPIDAISGETDTINAVNDAMSMEALPPIPEVMPEYEDVPVDSNQYQDDVINYENLVPVDENGYTVNNEPNWDSLVPIDEEADKTQRLGIWDESKLKLDAGNLTQYRADLAKQVWAGNMTLEEAQSLTKGRHQELLNKYGITEMPDFSFAKFKSDPLRTILGETAQMLPFYGEGLKKGAAWSLVTVPIAVGKNALAGATAGTAATPGAGTAIGGGAGIVSGLIEGISNGMLIGTFHTSLDVEGMNLYLDLKEKGIDDNTAKVAGISGGILNGLLETASFGVMTAPVKGAAKKPRLKCYGTELKTAQRLRKCSQVLLLKLPKNTLREWVQR